MRSPNLSYNLKLFYPTFGSNSQEVVAIFHIKGYYSEKTSLVKNVSREKKYYIIILT